MLFFVAKTATNGKLSRDARLQIIATRRFAPKNYRRRWLSATASANSYDSN
jgi:hypothetical protein